MNETERSASAAPHGIASSKSARVALWTGAAVSLGLSLIPFGDTIGYPLVLISTVAHELGHGITALFLGGTLEQIVVYRTAGGVTNYSIVPGWRVAIVAAGGLIGPSVTAALCFRFARTPFGAKAIACFFALVLVWVVLFVGASNPHAVSTIDRWFAPAFMSLLAVFLVGLVLRGNETFCQFAVIFLAIQLAVSVFTRADYLFTRSVNGRPNSASDVEQIAQQLFLPYWFWGIVCGGLSIAILAYGLSPYWGRTARTSSPQKSAGPNGS